MTASTPDPLLDVDNPSALIRGRIRERRIFEARFLCRQLADELGEMERNTLEAELARLLGQVERLRQQARAHAEEGRHQQAARTFREIERIAIDVPGLAAERQALEGARAVLARITDTAVQRELEQTRLEATPPLPADEAPHPALARNRRRPARRLPRLWLAALLFGLVLAVVLFVLLRPVRKDAPVPPMAPAAPAQQIHIRPLVAAGPPEPTPPPAARPAEGDAPAPAGSLRLGELQVRPSGRD